MRMRDELGAYEYNALRKALTSPDPREHWPGEEAEDGEPITPLDEMRGDIMWGAL